MTLKRSKDEIDKAMKEVDFAKICKSRIQESMSKIDYDKIKDEIENAMKEVDIAKIEKEIKESMAKIDWDKMKAEMEKLKEIDMKNGRGNEKTGRNERSVHRSKKNCKTQK